MANVVFVEDTKGDVVDAEYFCSDFHAQTHKGYDGWYGCVELEVGQQCSAEDCSEWLHGSLECGCSDSECVKH